jgi:hypothetical protein
MTDDLERRLREARPICNHSANAGLCHEAADEIARLRAENETNLAAMLWAAEEFDEERGETPDGWFGHCRKNIVAGFSEEHCGDCTNVPQSCMKCWADHYLERARQALQEGPSHE